jgi:YtkA-like protein
MKEVCGVLILLPICAGSLLADGGALLVKQNAGPLTISIFSSPEPLRVGTGDISVMVQRSEDKSTVLDATVKLHLTHSTPDGISEIFVPATHQKATNKLLYASQVNLTAEGAWKLVCTVDSKAGNAEVAANINVMPAQPRILTYWPYFAVVPLIVILFAINQWLKAKRKATNPRVHA